MVYLLRSSRVRSETWNPETVSRRVDDENPGRAEDDTGNVGDGGNCGNLTWAERESDGIIAGNLGLALEIVTVIDLRRFWKDCSTNDLLRLVLPWKPWASRACLADRSSFLSPLLPKRVEGPFSWSFVRDPFNLGKVS
jgi:hypothetical protein